MEIAINIFLIVVILFASGLQGSVGMGLGMIAAPIFALVRPDLFPATIIVLATFLSFSLMLREWSAIDWKMFSWIFLGRIPGSYLGGIAVLYLPQILLAILLSFIILVGLLSTARGWTPHASRMNMIAAGGISGIFGTATSVGGPPIIAVMRNFQAASIRATLSAIFTFGSIISLLVLWLNGALVLNHILAAGSLAPFMFAGLLLSNIAVRYLSRQRLLFAAALSSVGSVVLVLLQTVLTLFV